MEEHGTQGPNQRWSCVLPLLPDPTRQPTRKFQAALLSGILFSFPVGLLLLSEQAPSRKSEMVGEKFLSDRDRRSHGARLSAET